MSNTTKPCAWHKEQLTQLEAVREEMIEKKVRFKVFPKNSEGWS